MTPTADGRLAAAIDIGSNSIKMTVGRPDGRGGIEQLAWASEVVRLGEGVATTGRLDQRRADAAIETLRRFAAQARDQGATCIVAVATEATRAAANGTAFLERVRRETGVDVRVIGGGEEAELTFRGLAASTDLTEPSLIADIGGGSTEVIAAVDGAMSSSRSVPLGSGRLTEQCVRTDPPTLAELAACEAEASRVIGDALGELGAPATEGSRLLLVGGTGEYLVRLLPEGQSPNLNAVRNALLKLTEITAAQLAERIAIPEARARVLPAGVAIVAAIAERVVPGSIEVSYSGVRAGLLLELFQKTQGECGADPQPIGTADGLDQESDRPTDDGSRERERPEPDADFRETMRSLIAERWAVVWDVIPVALAGEDIEGVHDVRVASRRLRAAMDIAAPVFPKAWYAALHRTAKEITRALGAVRDRDVLLEALRADRANAPRVERPGIDRLIDRIERERIAARREMESFLEELLAGPTAIEVKRRFASPSQRESSTQTGSDPS